MKQTELATTNITRYGQQRHHHHYTNHQIIHCKMIERTNKRWEVCVSLYGMLTLKDMDHISLRASIHNNNNKILFTSLYHDFSSFFLLLLSFSLSLVFISLFVDFSHSFVVGSGFSNKKKVRTRCFFHSRFVLLFFYLYPIQAFVHLFLFQP